ncbi:MAG: hypothetical protein BRC25_03020 [Parcubacteria group bacterium SW_6_46_9]|nr:MAG: hypothetical protein BRC25_03020 [Parcubacteria group bacterium SW_6_46_9]
MDGNNSGKSPESNLKNPELTKILDALDVISEMVNEIKEEIAKSNIPTGDVEFKDGLLHRGSHSVKITGKIQTGLILMLINAGKEGVSTQKIKDRFNLTQHLMHNNVHYLRKKIGKLNLSIECRDMDNESRYVLIE